MKRGDMIRIYAGSHGYPDGWQTGDPPIEFPVDTTGIFLKKNGDYPRIFYRVVTDRGVVGIFSGHTGKV